MIVGMPSRIRPQQRYDHRLRDLVRRTGDVTLATDLGVTRSTARGWLAEPATVVVSLEGASLTELEFRQEILRLRRRVQKLAALLRLMLAVQRAVGFSFNAPTASRRSRQAADPTGRRSGPHVHAATGAPVGRSVVTESVPCLIGSKPCFRAHSR
jgi:hypothetical protein